MSFELWLAFAAASAAVLAVPGPTVTLVVGYALGRGARSGWVTVPAVTLGDFTAMTVSLAGAGAVLAASATLFTALKLIGAAYLIWLGIQLWRAPATLDSADAPVGSESRSMFRHAYLVTTFNPKSIVFFIAFVPQFVDPGAPALMQFAVLEVTFLVLAAANVLLWAVLAGKLRDYFRRPGAVRLANRIGGSFLIGAGLLAGAARRAA